MSKQNQPSIGATPPPLAAGQEWKQDGALVLRKSDDALRFEARDEAQAYNAVFRHNATLPHSGATEEQLQVEPWRTVETFAVFGSAAPSTLRDIYQGERLIAESVPFFEIAEPYARRERRIRYLKSALMLFVSIAMFVAMVLFRVWLRS